MTAVVASLVLPFDQVLERGFRGPLLKGALGAVLALAGLAALAQWGLAALAGGTGIPRASAIFASQPYMSGANLS